MKTAQHLFNEAFSEPRDLRSPEYKAGVLAGLKFRLRETNHIQCPYTVGTAQADAWFAGVDEGHHWAVEYRVDQAVVIGKTEADLDVAKSLECLR